MGGAGIVVDLLFAAFGLVPTGPRPVAAMTHMHFAWNYTTWLDLAALVVGGALVWRHARAGRDGASEAHGTHAHHGETAGQR